MKRNKKLPRVVWRTRWRVTNAYAHTNTHFKGIGDGGGGGAEAGAGDGDNETTIRRRRRLAGKLYCPLSAADNRCSCISHTRPTCLHWHRCGTKQLCVTAATRCSRYIIYSLVRKRAPPMRVARVIRIEILENVYPNRSTFCVTFPLIA